MVKNYQTVAFYKLYLRLSRTYSYIMWSLFSSSQIESTLTRNRFFRFFRKLALAKVLFFWFFVTLMVCLTMVTSSLCPYWTFSRKGYCLSIMRTIIFAILIILLGWACIQPRPTAAKNREKKQIQNRQKAKRQKPRTDKKRKVKFKLQKLGFLLVLLVNNYKGMSLKSNLNKNGWNDSMHIFFSPKLSLEGRNMLPQLADSMTYQRDQNFLTVFKKPIINVYDKISTRRERKMVHVEGEHKQMQKRAFTNNQKKRNISVELEEQLTRNYRDTISQVSEFTRLQPKKAITNNKVTQGKQKIQNEQYFFYLGPGNNSELVDKILTRRAKWTKTSSSLFHFRWEQARPKFQSNSTNRQLLNHLPNHEAISDKAGLTKNLRIYCLKTNIAMFRMIPACFELDFGKSDSCELEIKKFIDFYWQCIEKSNTKYFQNDFSDNNPEQKNSANPDSPKKISKKDSPMKTIKNFRTHRKETNPVLSPQLVKKKQEVKQLHKTLLSKLRPVHNFLDMSHLKKQSSAISPIPLEIYGDSGLWLLKPADMNRGRGIHLFRRIDELGEVLKAELLKNEKASFIVQKYIERPMLIHDRKFDIRVYAMLTQNKQLYFFKEGYIRTSSMKFDLNNNSQYAHLTNNAIQKHSKAYGEFEEGNILPLSYLVDNMGMNRVEVYDEMKNMVKVTMRAGYSEMFKNIQKVQGSSLGTSSSAKVITTDKMKQFQIFGYDFMVDEAGHIWIIEVNTNPCIELSCSWLKQIIPRMLDDAFKLTVDRLFPKGRVLKENVNEFFPVDGYKDEQNMWEFMDMKSESQLSESCTLL